MRSGAWVTAERLRNYSFLLLLVSVVSIGYLIASKDGVNDFKGRPLGTDYSNVYAAGTYALEDTAENAYMPQLQHGREQYLFGEETPFYGWHYPPFFLLIASALALMPYLLSLFVWQAATLALYLRSLWDILPQRALLLPALAFPAVVVNIGHGHNGFLTAALIGMGLLWLKPKPILAGICIGLLAYKPQFGLLIPLALLAGGHYRAFFSATLMVGALSALVTALYGEGIWHAFLGSLEFTREMVLEQGDTGFHKIQSVFAAVRLLGGGVSFAYDAQIFTIIVLAVTLVWLWRSSASDEIKYAALIVGSLLATPYSLDYDLMVLAPAFAFLVRHGLRQGFAPWEISLIAFAWSTPLYARSVAVFTHVPLAVIAMLLLYCMLVRRRD